MTNPETTPVIIGVGQINDRPEDPDLGLDSPGLMIAALKAAEVDTGVTLLGEIDRLAIVDQISFRHLGNLCAQVAEGIGADPDHNEQSPAPHGDTPIRFLNEAANAIASGTAKLCAVTGGEALRTAAGRAAKAAKADPAAFNALRGVATRKEPNYAQSHGLIAPVDIYPLYENAGRAAYGQTFAEGQAESGAIWAAMSQVAAGEDGAWIRKPVSAAEVLTPSSTNRPIAFPYTKLTVANSSVNQGAAFIVASVAEARRRGIPDNHMIHIGAGAAAKEDGSILRRDRFDRSVSMDVSIRRTLALNGMTAADFDHVELYSCFPCVPKMARRVLGWPLDKPSTVFGGLTFGGGPIANYMSHAVVAMVQKLRVGGRYGFLFANGGFATDNHCIVLGRELIATANLPQPYDYQAEADAARDPIPVLDKDYTGSAIIETYTIFYNREGEPRDGVVVARTPEGNRTLAHVDVSDADMVAFLTDGEREPVGVAGTIVAGDRRVFRR
jgi:acetyl-CoA C-acetyltransferase